MTEATTTGIQSLILENNRIENDESSESKVEGPAGNNVAQMTT